MTTRAVGLFGRQAAINLSVPPWVTLFVSREALAQPGFAGQFLPELLGAVATVGSVGATVVLDSDVADWNRQSYHQTLEIALGDVQRARPYFRFATCNASFLQREDGRGLLNGRRLTVAHGERAWVPEEDSAGETVLLDTRSTLVSRTSNPQALLRGVYRDLTPQPAFESPHWQTTLGPGLLRRLCVLMTVNALCKPHEQTLNAFFFASEYADVVVARAVNERHLRPRWMPEQGEAPPTGSAADSAAPANEQPLETAA